MPWIFRSVVVHRFFAEDFPIGEDVGFFGLLIDSVSSCIRRLYYQFLLRFARFGLIFELLKFCVVCCGLGVVVIDLCACEIVLLVVG